MALPSFCDGSGVYAAEEVVVHAVVGIFLGKWRAQEAVAKRSFSGGQVKLGGDAAILHFVQGDGLRANAVFHRSAVEVAAVALGGRLRQYVFDLGNERTRAGIAVHAHGFDFTVILVGIGEVVVAKDARGRVVMVFPAAIFPFELLAEGRHFAGARGVADTDQAVSDVAGGLDFDVAVAGLVAVAAVFCPDEFFQAFGIVSAIAGFGVDVNAAGARIPAVGGGVVFKGAVLGTPPDEVGAIFFLVFRFVAGRACFPDAVVGKADGRQVFVIAHVGRPAEFAANAAAFVVR